MAKLKLSKFRSGKSGVVEQEVKAGVWAGSVFVWRCRKDRYYSEVPSVLNIPFAQESMARDYGLKCFNEGFRCSMRRAKRTSGKWEVQVYFPMGFTVKNAVESLEENPWTTKQYV